MSPAIFKYKGIVIRVFTLDHKPVHVHAFVQGGYGMKVIFHLEENKIIRIEYVNLKGKKNFSPAMMRDLKKLVDLFKEKMVSDFITLVIEQKPIHNTIIISKL